MRETPAQDYLVDYVRRNPGCSQYAASVACGPHGSNRYGYATVMRAIEAGRVRREGTFGERWRLYVA
jgi:hypothetical protein